MAGDDTFTADIDVKVGSCLVLGGHVNKSAERFCINLFSGSQGDILFAARFEFGDKEVIRNHCVGNTWGSIERQGEMTLRPAGQFVIVIDFLQDHLKMKVNRDPEIHFNYRLTDVTTITSVGVKYHATIQSFRIVDPVK